MLVGRGDRRALLVGEARLGQARARQRDDVVDAAVQVEQLAEFCNAQAGV
jgi:hypothetical protein